MAEAEVQQEKLQSEQLLKEHGINENTAALLADQGFLTVDSLSVLDSGDIPSLKTKQLAQRKLLERMIGKLQQTAGSAASSLTTSGVSAESVPVSAVPVPNVQTAGRLDLASIAGEDRSFHHQYYRTGQH